MPFKSLTQQQRANLVSMASGNGWEDLNELMKDEIREMAGEHFALPNGNAEEIAESRAEIRGVVRFYQRIIRSVQYQVQENMTELKAALDRKAARELKPEDFADFVVTR